MLDTPGRRRRREFAAYPAAIRLGVALGCSPYVAAALALALGVDVALSPPLALTATPAERVGVGVEGVGPDVAGAVGSAVGVGDVDGAAVADGTGVGVPCPRRGDGVGFSVDRAGPTGLITCWAGPGDGVVRRPIPATAPITAAARQTPPPAAIARRRQRSRRPLVMISATSAGPA
jgi:hypothetical protein